MSKFYWNKLIPKMLTRNKVSFGEEPRASADVVADGDAAIEQLIPWYLNGTLDEAEMNQINGKLDESQTFNRSMELDLKIAGLLTCEPAQLASTLQQKEQGFAQLLNTIHRHEAPRPLRRSAFASVGGVAALSLALIAAVSFYWLDPREQANNGHAMDNFQTLTDPGTTGGPVLQIIFESETPEREIRRMLLDRDAHLISGPTAGGVYRVELPAAMDSESYIRQLQANSAVRWVELEVR